MKNSFTSLDKVIDRKSNRINSYSVLRRQLSGFVRAIRFKKAFTPLEKATDKVGGGKDRAADGGLMPPSAETVRERSSLTGFTRLRQKAPPFMAGMNGKVSLAEVRQDLWRTKAGLKQGFGEVLPFIFRKPRDLSRGGFTLVEMLVAICIFSIIAAALGGVLFSGVGLWQRAQSVGYSQTNMLLELELFSRRLRQSLDIEEIPFSGDNVSVEFPSLTANSLLKVRYIFDSTNKEFRYGKMEYQDIFAEEEQNDEDYSESFLFKAEEVSFAYLTFNSEDNTYLWKNSLEIEDGIPAAIKITVDKDAEEFQRIIFIPIHERYI